MSAPSSRGSGLVIREPVESFEWWWNVFQSVTQLPPVLSSLVIEYVLTESVALRSLTASLAVDWKGPVIHSLTPAALQFVVAPMVNQCDLPFRMLTRRYGATLVYSQMIDAERYLRGGTAFRRSQLQFIASPPTPGTASGGSTSIASSGSDRPLIVQICGNRVHTIVAAAKLILSDATSAGAGVDGIDLNLGCPQDRAKSEHFGAYLCARRDWPLLYRMVRQLTIEIAPVPVTVKLRLLSSTQLTIEFVRMLIAAGAALIAVHGRTLINSDRRRCGPADLDAIKSIRDAVVKSVPILTNGNVRTRSDVLQNIARTGCEGAMVAEAVLENPTLFDATTLADAKHQTVHAASPIVAVPNTSPSDGKTQIAKRPPPPPPLLSLDRSIAIGLEYLALCDHCASVDYQFKISPTSITIQLQHLKNLVRPHLMLQPMPKRLEALSLVIARAAASDHAFVNSLTTAQLRSILEKS